MSAALVPLCFAATLARCVGAGDDTVVGFDAGTPARDAGNPARDDLGNPDDRPLPQDTGAPLPSDTGVQPPLDAGNPQPLDTGVPPPIDTGVPSRDTGVPSGDTGIRPVDNGPPPVDSGPPPPVDAGPTRCDSPPPEVLASQPAFSPAVIARIRALRAAGVARGNRLDVLAKIGDSITEAGGFLTDLGMGWYELGPYACLEPTVAFFRRTAVPNAVNSLARSSVCAMGGWLSDNALQGDPMSPLRAELNAIRPGYAVIMYGTNDLDRGSAAGLETNLERMAQICEDFGTVPVLSTIPDRLDQAAPASRVAGYNERIRGVAAARNLPLIDYWAAMRPLPRNGIEEDGIHPSVYRRDGSAEAGYFTDEGTRFGYNMRNLTTMMMMHRLRALSQD